MGPNIDPCGIPQVMFLARIFHHLIRCIVFYSLGSWKTTCCLFLLFHKKCNLSSKIPWMVESKVFERSRNTPKVTSNLKIGIILAILRFTGTLPVVMISHNIYVLHVMRIIQQLVIRLHLSVDALLLRMIIEPSNNELSFHGGIRRDEKTSAVTRC